MATKKISELEAISEAASDDVLAIVDVSETETRKITKGNLLVGAGHTIEMSLNSTTYTLTLSLKNEAGTVLNTQTIDLPNENALTNITYSNGILTLTKQNGETSIVDISGLISGLLSETTFNAFVTEIEEIIGISTDTYRTTSTYNTGDIVIYNGKIYKCNNNNVTGTFDDTKWDEISLYEYQKLQDQKIENKVEKENGKGLSTNDYTTAEKNKLSGIETGAEVNVIESVKVNGTALTPTDKEVDVPVPTKTSDLNNDSGFGTYTKPSGGIPKTDLASDVQTSLGKADTAVQEEHKTGSRVEYKVLSDNNYTDEEKAKLASLENYDDSDITERVDDIEEEQETQNEDIEKLQDKVANQQKIISQMPKVPGEGTEFTMENTIEAQFAEFLPGGNTEQETTNGYQLLHDSDGSKTLNGVTFTENTEDGSVLINGTATANTTFEYFNKQWTTFPAGTYRLSGTPSSASATTHRLICWKEGWTVLGTDIGNGTTITLSEDTKIRVQIVIASGTTINNAVYRPMLEVGSTTHSWEKYTGGIASPNVDYPQERYSAGANGSITEKIYYDLKQNPTVLNALLAVGGGTLESTNYEKTLYVPCKPNRTYKIQKIAGSRFRVDERSSLPTTGSANVNLQYSDTASSLNYTTSANAQYLLISFYNTSRDTISQEEMLASIKIEDVAITQTYTMPVQQEMRDIKDSNGNVIAKDEFIEKDGVKYERHNIARVIFDGTEGWTVEQSAGMKRFNHTFSDLYYYNGRGEYAKSNYFHSTTESEYGAIITYQLRIMIYVSENITTVEQFKAWIAEKYATNNPFYVDYVLSTPLDLPCTQEQIDVLEDLPETYAEQTNVLSEDTVPAYVKASGYSKIIEVINKNDNVLYNKKYVTLGDSFTHGDFTNAPEDNYHLTDGIYKGKLKVYPFIIGNRNLMNVINLAVNGMTLASRPSDTNSIMQSENYKTIPADVDYITIKIGINDDSAHQNLPLGTIDSTDTSTFYGAYNELLTYLITNYPNAKIGLIATNASTIEIVNATIAIGARYGIPVLNESTDTNVPLLLRTNRSDVLSTIKDIRDANWKVSTTQGAINGHPNAKCHEYESTIIENWLRTL